MDKNDKNDKNDTLYPKVVNSDEHALNHEKIQGHPKFYMRKMKKNLSSMTRKRKVGTKTPSTKEEKIT